MMRKPKILKAVPRNCMFCEGKTVPMYREIETLRRFISERGKIQSHARTGICSRHQRRLSVAIKQARHLALLPFIAS